MIINPAPGFVKDILIKFFRMMKNKIKIVTTTAVFQPGYPAESAVSRLAGLGFEALDMAFDYWTEKDSPFMSDGCLKWAEKLRVFAEDAGAPYKHSHAPGEAGNDPVIGRSIECAAALGAKYMVLHPVWRNADGSIIEDREEFISRNAVEYGRWLDKARGCGVVILSENLLWGASKDPKVISDLVREIGSDSFGWCYDTGHANCFGYKPSVLLECSEAPLSLHMQDNHGTPADEHLIPGDGTVDWDSLIRTLKAVGYPGDCVLEAHHQSLDAPDEERDAILSRLLIKARELRSNMEER